MMEEGKHYSSALLGGQSGAAFRTFIVVRCDIKSEPRRNVVLTVLNYIIQYRFTYGLKCVANSGEPFVPV